LDGCAVGWWFAEKGCVVGEYFLLNGCVVGWWFAEEGCVVGEYFLLDGCVVRAGGLGRI
jgi:hypothetical protein